MMVVDPVDMVERPTEDVRDGPGATASTEGCPPGF